LRILGIGAVTIALLLVVGFSWFVVISWNVLSTSLGLIRLVLVLAVAALAAGTWASVVVRRVGHLAPRPMTRLRRVAVGPLSLLAVITGLIAVPATRARLESSKCLHHAAPDAGSQARCRAWLERRREWWTLGLSHKNPGSANTN
jgi:hypothetical protein